MAKRILVPLDKTIEAELVLPLVADVARGSGGTVRLLHVAPSPESVADVNGRVIAYADQETGRLDAEAKDYLRMAETQLDGIPVECVVRFGNAVEEILAEAEEFGADLIALTTRHQGRFTHLVLGSTADQVCRRSDLAVVVYRRGHHAGGCFER